MRYSLRRRVMSGGRAQDGVLRLRDGRALAYTEWGDVQGPPVFFFHGWGLSRLWCPDEEANARAGVRLVVVDRPGYGGSDLQPGRRLEDWPDDVAQLADVLGFDRFSVVGFSGGGPHAIVSAALLRERVTRAGVVSTGGLARVRPGAVDELDEEDQMTLSLVERSREEAAATIAAKDEEWARAVVERPERWLDDLPVTDVNRWFREDPVRMAPFLRAAAEAFRQGAEGAAWDRVIFHEPWPFRLDEITAEVHVWHGELDVITPRANADFLAGAISGCRLTIWSEDGHIGIARHWDEILETLIG
jgi:pimeloyl-ACP methyl ester carboxylesterase